MNIEKKKSLSLHSLRTLRYLYTLNARTRRRSHHGGDIDDIYDDNDDHIKAIVSESLNLTDDYITLIIGDSSETQDSFVCLA